ncbi:hypothetical protein K435DRAFT_778451, partial [Dendrothele bispora CBS 962.96]
MPRGTTCGRSAGNAVRGSVRGGASGYHGTFTSARIPTPPTSDGLILETPNQSRVRQQEVLGEQLQGSSRIVRKGK